MNERRFEPATNISKRWSTHVKVIVAISGLIIFVWALFRFSALLPPLIIAIILAYLMTPAVNWLSVRARLPRVLALLLVDILLLGLVALIPAAVVPSLVNQFTTFRLDLAQVLLRLVDLLSSPITILGFEVQLPDLRNQLADAVRGLLSPVAISAVGILVDIVSSLAWFIFILVASFYMVKDSHRIARYFKGLIPPDYQPEVLRLVSEISGIWDAFFRGQLLLSAVVGVATGVVMASLGVSNAAILGLLAGVLEIIPNFGPVLAAIPAILLALFQGSSYIPLSNTWFALVVAGAYVIIQQVENNYLVPRIIGRSVRLHPVVVLVGAVAGAYLGGVLGVLLAAPTIASLRILARYAYRKILDLDPFGDTMVPVSEPAFPQTGMLCGQEIEAVLFDLDGTLIDSDDAAVEELANRMQKLQPLLPSQDAVRTARRLLLATEGPTNTLITLLDKVGLDDNVFRLRDRLLRAQGQSSAVEFRLMEGVPELLYYLKRRFKLGIVSTRSRPEVEAFLAQFGFDGLFDAVVTRDDVQRLKPHPEPVLLAAERLGVPAHHCALVGDTGVDMASANAAGSVSIGILSGFGTREDLEDADLLLEAVSDLRSWL